MRGPQSKRGWGGGGAGIGGRVLPTSSRLRARFKGAYNFSVPWGERPSLACAASGCGNPIRAAASSSMASGTDCAITCGTKPAAGMSRIDPGRLQGPGSTRLRVASLVTKDHVREPRKEADLFVWGGLRSYCPSMNSMGPIHGPPQPYPVQELRAVPLNLVPSPDRQSDSVA